MNEPNARVPLQERRAEERTAEERPLAVELEATALSGQSRNLSADSVFLLADEELRVRVTFEDDGVTRTGHLVRYQRMPSGGSGWAIELER